MVNIVNVCGKGGEKALVTNMPCVLGKYQTSKQPCKHAVMCQNWASYGPMVPASTRNWPSSGNACLQGLLQPEAVNIPEFRIFKARIF